MKNIFDDEKVAVQQLLNDKLNEFEKELINAIPIPNQYWLV